MALPATETFTNSNGVALTTHSASWTNNAGTFAINSNAVYATDAGQDCAAHWNADTFANDQYAQGVIVALGSTYIGVSVRCHASANTHYGFEGNATDSYFYKYVNGSYTQLGSTGGNFTNGQTLRIEASGTTITPKINGSTISPPGAQTDSSISSGYAGIAGSGNNAVSRLDTWEGGNIGGGAATLTISVSDSTTVSETVTLFTNILHRSVSDSVTVAETVSRQLIGNRSVSDSAAVSDSVTVVIATTGDLTVSVSDSAVLSEGVTLFRTPLYLSVSDSASVTDSPSVTHIGGVGATGVLTVSANPRYFRNNDGIVVLTGFHNWYTLVDGGVSDPPPVFDYEAWLDFCEARGGNTFKLWTHETPKDWPDESGTRFVPLPWARTGPGNAADGKLKFDLDTWDETYFARMRARAIAAGNRGFYVVIQLFQGWQADIKGLSPGDPIANHPFTDGNNINSVDGNSDDDDDILEIRDTANTAIYNRQKAYVEKVIDTINDLDNVLIEISNEETATSTVTAWQHALIDYIHSYESGKSKQHPVGMTWQWPGGNNATDLYTSNADWISYGGNNSTPLANPPVWPDTGATGFVSLWDTDHMGGLVLDTLYVWRAFTRGHNVLFMDSYDGTFGDDWTANADAEEIRANLGYIQDYASRLDLANATPNGALAETGFALAKTTAGQAQILAYQDGTGAFDIDLSALPGEFTLEWLRVSNGTVQAGSNVNGGASRTLTPPWAGDAVAFLEQFALSVSESESVTVSETRTVVVLLGGVSVSDSTSVGDSPTVRLASPINVTDGATVTDAPTVRLDSFVNATDSASVTDTPTIAPLLVGLSVSDSVSVAESVTVTRVSQDEYVVSVSETVSTSETVNVVSLLGGVAVNESVTVSETVTRALTIAISVSESVSASDTPALTTLLAGISVSDSVALGETVGLLVTPLYVGVGDSLSVGDSVQVAIDTPGFVYETSVSESVSVGELVTLLVVAIATPRSRIFSIPGENRTFSIPFEDRIYRIED